MHPVLFHIGAVYIPSYGAMAAVGVLLALLTAQQTARVVKIAPAHLWNLCVLALCAALIGARLLLIVVNWRDLLRHPMWMLGLAMIHHPLVAAAGAALGLFVACFYAHAQRLPILSTADALAAPVAVALAMEQWGTLLSGSGFGIDARVPWAVTYTNLLASRWSGTPIGVPLHPVQAYAALAAMSIAIVLLMALPLRRQAGDVTGLGLLTGGVAIFITEFWRDWDGRGAILHGALDAPQIAGVAMVLFGAFLLRERTRSRLPQPCAQSQTNEAEHD